MKYLAKEQDILAWLKANAENYTVYAPKTIAKSVTFQEYTTEELANAKIEDLLDYTTSSPKNAFIPQSEVLFTYTSTKNADDLSKVNTILHAKIEAKPSIVFGSRPCDVRGVEILDMAYLKGRYQDPYYKARRDNTIIIAQACTMALPTCFCNWTGVDLTNADTADIMLTSIEDGYILEAKSDKAKELLKNASFKEASAKDDSALETVQNMAKQSVEEAPNLEAIPSLVLDNFENKEYWTSVTSACIGCSSCTFVCPTCQCFTITDEGNPLEGKRIRSWSSCMAEEFTREASGHNPRAFGFTRWRNRLSHKFSYMHSWHKSHSCTGCGRCLISCPASISIKGMLEKILALSPTTKPTKAKAEAKPKAEPKTKAEAKPKSTAKAKSTTKTTKKGVE